MRGVRIGGGVARAILLAGPLFAATAICADAASRPGAGYGAGALAGLLVLTPFVMLFGAIAAVVPIAAGAALMASIGRGNVGMRLPAVWALAGAGLGALLPLLVAGGEGAGVMAAVGAGCALVCRSGVRWAD